MVEKQGERPEELTELPEEDDSEEEENEINLQ